MGNVIKLKNYLAISITESEYYNLNEYTILSELNVMQYKRK